MRKTDAARSNETNNLRATKFAFFLVKINPVSGKKTKPLTSRFKAQYFDIYQML